MTPNYFRMAQDLARAPKMAQPSGYILWALAVSPAVVSLRKLGADAIRATHSPKASR